MRAHLRASTDIKRGNIWKHKGIDDEEIHKEEIDREEGHKIGASRSRRQHWSSKGKGKKGLVDKQPQVKQQAAVAHAMFLYADDAWSLRYFDQNDLHFKEREVFG